MASSVLPRLYKPEEIFASIFISRPSRDKTRPMGFFDSEIEAVSLFAGWKRPGDIWYAHSLRNVTKHFDRLSEERKSRLRLIHGTHIEFGLHELIGRPLSYFTLIREPVDRAISHYYHTSENRFYPEDVRFADHLASLVEPNLQTRLFAGPAKPGVRLSPDDMLRKAIENLRACTVVGLTERFDETLILLKKAYGWPWPFYEIRNVGKTRPPLEAFPNEVIKRIRACHRQDIELYEEARRIFDVQVAHYGPDFHDDLKRFRFRNRWWRRGRAVRNWILEIPTSIQKATYDPVYFALARWGGTRRLLPARLKPRVVRELEDGRLYIDVKIGKRLAGSFDPRTLKWEIRRPYHLFVDEQSLPLSSPPPESADTN